MSNFIVDIPTRKVTVKEVYEGMVKNGFEVTRRQFLATGFNGEILGACIVSQAALNLDIVPSNRNWIFLNVKIAERYVTPTLMDALDNFKIPLDSRWGSGDDRISTSLGSTIIYWFDERRGEDWLLTYDEALEMAHELMEPYFDEVIEVTSLSAARSYVPETI